MKDPIFLNIPYVIVKWEDAYQDADEEQTQKQYIEQFCPALQESIGWLVHRDEKVLMLAQSQVSTAHGEQPIFRDVLHIPAGCVRRIKKLNYTL